jgi:hypothetical protein
MRTTPWSQKEKSIFHIYFSDLSKWLFVNNIGLLRAFPQSLHRVRVDTPTPWSPGHSRPGPSIPWVDFRGIWS